MTKIDFTSIITPYGDMFACATEQGVCMLEFYDRKRLDRQMESLITNLNSPQLVHDSSILNILSFLEEELYEYFFENREHFTVPLHLIGTDFQKKVWNELLKIPFGKTISYKELAVKIGNPKGCRAVANANAVNKISIIVPCHRVIGSNKQLVGYASGIERKRKLLIHEKYL